MAEIGDWSIFQWVVVILLFAGIYFIEKLLKEISNNVNEIRMQQRGIFLDYGKPDSLDD